MPTRTKREKARAAMRPLAACVLVLTLVLPGAAFADTLLGIKVTSPTYTITWDANDGNFSGSAAKTTSVKWGTATTPPAEPTRDGYKFEGWSSTKDGQPVTIFPANTTAATTWYAVWSLITYTITYSGLEGATVSNPTTYTIETPDFNLNNPTKPNYTFTGWSGAGIQGTSMSVTIPKGSKDDRAYTANWKLNEYQVTFMANYGTGTMDPQTFQHGVAQNLTQNSFTRTGYEFLGWSEDETATTAQYQDKASLTVTGPKTLYAVWALQVVCEVPTAAVVSIDASGEVKGEDQQFVSRSVAPLKVSAVKSERLAGAESVFADSATLSGIRVTLTPSASAGSPVHVPLATADVGQLASFTIPTNGTLSVSFGLTLPTNAKLSFLESAAQVAQLSYVIGPASS